jgi:hypothetical protein
MKKIFLILSLTILLGGCTENTIAKDSAYANEIMAQFHENMSIDEVRDKLTRFQTDIEFYNECLGKFEYPITPCEKGYNRIITIPLSNHHWWLGKGDAQFYFYFNSDQRLIEYMHELYYPRYH